MIEHYIRGFEEELREIRHQIHGNPELGLQEFKTSALVAEKLRQWGYEVEQGLATTGVVSSGVRCPQPCALHGPCFAQKV